MATKTLIILVTSMYCPDQKYNGCVDAISDTLHKLTSNAKEQQNKPRSILYNLGQVRIHADVAKFSGNIITQHTSKCELFLTYLI